jgi:membrane-bound serine protease (ClpP class)
VERLEKEKGVTVKRLTLISPKGKLLSLTAGEAVRYGLARGTADDQETLLSTLGAAPVATELTPSVSDRLVAILTSGPVQALLILVGLVALFLEINTPGFGIPGVIALVSFLGVFGANALLGSVGSLEMILFLVGIGLLAVEIFVIPGFGVVGISGFILIGASLVLAMQDFVVPTQDWQWDLLGRNLLVVTLGLIAAITGIAIIALTGPRLRIFDRLMLKTKIVGTAGGPDPDSLPAGAAVTTVAETGEPDYAALVGKRGVAVSTLRPSGKARIEGEVRAVEADGAFIEPGTEIEVVRVRGNRIVVKNAAARG